MVMKGKNNIKKMYKLRTEEGQKKKKYQAKLILQKK